MINRRPTEREPEELFERQSIIDLVLKFRIGIYIYPVGLEDRTGVKPLLEQQTFIEQ